LPDKAQSKHESGTPDHAWSPLLEGVLPPPPAPPTCPPTCRQKTDKEREKHDRHRGHDGPPGHSLAKKRGQCFPRHGHARRPRRGAHRPPRHGATCWKPDGGKEKKVRDWCSACVVLATAIGRVACMLGARGLSRGASLSAGSMWLRSGRPRTNTGFRGMVGFRCLFEGFE
jgi:hypothetical protein